MQRTRWWIPVFFLLVLMGAAHAQDPEPGKGETSVPRLLRILRVGDWDARERACRELGARDAAVLPELARAQAAARESQVDGYASLIGAARMRIAMRDSDALPVLLEQLKAEDPDVSATAARSLGLCPGDPTEALVALLDSENAQERELAVDVLALRGGVPPAARAAIRRLAVEDPERRVRWRAVVALGLLAPEDAEASIAALEKALSDPEPVTARNAAHALGRYGEPAWPTLARALNTEPVVAGWASGELAVAGTEAAAEAVRAVAGIGDEQARIMALRVVGAVGASDPVCADFVETHAGKVAEEVRVDALIAVPGCVLDPAKRRRLLEEALAEDSDAVRGAAGEAACLLDKAELETLVPALLESWLRPWGSAEASAGVVQALLNSRAEPQLLVDTAMQVLEHQPEMCGTRAVVVLAKCREEALPALRQRAQVATSVTELELLALAFASMGADGVPDLLALRNHAQAEVRSMAVESLGLTACASPELIAALGEALEDPELRHEAIVSLGLLGDEAHELRVDLLRKASRLPTPERIELIAATARTDPDAPRFLAVASDAALEAESAEERKAGILALARGEESPRKRFKVFETLLQADQANQTLDAALRSVRELDDPPKRVVEAIIDLLEHRAWQIRTLSAKALEEFGESAAPAAVALSRRFQDPHEFVRLSSLRAAGQLGPAAIELSTRLGMAATSNLGDSVAFAVDALVSLGADARAALPYLAYCLLHQDLERVFAKREELDGGLAKGVWSFAISTPSFAEARVRAAELLAEIAVAHPDEAALVRPVLERAAHSPDEPVAAAARAALERVAR